MVLPLFVFLKHSASQTGYQGGGHESRPPTNEGYVFTLCSMPACRGHGAIHYAVFRWGDEILLNDIG
jgi:hypothetical protein